MDLQKVKEKLKNLSILELDALNAHVENRLDLWRETDEASRNEMQKAHAAYYFDICSQIESEIDVRITDIFDECSYDDDE